MSQENNFTSNGIISKIIESLHLGSIPGSFRGNLAFDSLLFLGLMGIIAEPIFANIDSILITVFNFILTLQSKALLPARDVDMDLTSKASIIMFVVAMILCPLWVLLLEGFKIAKDSKHDD